jgi:tetratricopeptide (TPR) repeat protein
VTLEDTMFFTRLRRHAKWMFVFLALVFGLGFVVFGIGSDQGTGIGDILRDQGGATEGSLSVGEAREALAENPRSIDAQRDLATALQNEGETEEAITVLTKLTTQAPKEEDALRELGALQLGRANTFSQQAQEAQFLASFQTFDPAFSNSLKLGDSGATLGEDPIQQAISTRANEAITSAYTKAQESYQAAEDTYTKLAAAAPNDPNVQLELAGAAQQSGDLAKAIAAYERFLELAPDDPSAEIVKQQVAQLKAAQAPPSSG